MTFISGFGGGFSPMGMGGGTGPFGMGGNASVAAGDSAFNFFNASEQRLALASRMTGNESDRERLRFGAMDKQLAMRQRQEDTNQLYLYNWGKQQEQRREKDRQQRQRMHDAGALFF